MDITESATPDALKGYSAESLLKVREILQKYIEKTYVPGTKSTEGVNMMDNQLTLFRNSHSD